MVEFPTIIDVQAKPLPPRPRSENPLPEYVTPQEASALVENAKTPRQRLAILTMWRAGLRVSEMLALRVEDLRLDEHSPNGTRRPVIVVYGGKGSYDRHVPVQPDLLSAYKLLLPHNARGQIWRQTRMTAWRWVRRASLRAANAGHIAEARAEVISPHTLRHGAARYWLDCGIPLHRVSAWLGHRSVATTMIYLKLVPDAAGDMQHIP